MVLLEAEDGLGLACEAVHPMVFDVTIEQALVVRESIAMTEAWFLIQDVADACRQTISDMRLWVDTDGRRFQGLGQWFGRGPVVIGELTLFLRLSGASVLILGCQTAAGREENNNTERADPLVFHMRTTEGCGSSEISVWRSRFLSEARGRLGEALKDSQEFSQCSISRVRSKAITLTSYPS